MLNGNSTGKKRDSDPSRDTGTGAPLLSENGSASIATTLMMSHHALRRDLGLFAAALGELDAGDRVRAGALREEWHKYRSTLHGHHEAEDTRLFPHLSQQHPPLADVIEQLTADHHRIDPLLERGDRAFDALPDPRGATTVVTELAALLHPHLATEEAHVVPFLREARQFPPPTNDLERQMYAQGFAWSSHGIAPEVLDAVYAMLPEDLRVLLPAARTAFEARCRAVWGSASIKPSRTSVPQR